MVSDEHRRIARNWIARAFRDLANAKVLAQADPLSPNSMWLMQQSDEKGIKALLINNGTVFRKIHDLEELRLALPDDSKFREHEFDLQKLTELGKERADILKNLMSYSCLSFVMPLQLHRESWNCLRQNLAMKLPEQRHTLMAG